MLLTYVAAILVKHVFFLFVADHSNDGHHDDHSYDTEKEYPTPPPDWLKSHPEALMDHPPHGSDDHSHDSDDHSHDDHEHHHHHDDHQPDIEFDHDHHVHQPDIIFDHDTPHSYPYHHSFPSFPVYPHYPEIIYDDHHHHHHDEPPPPTTTEAPLPEPPPEPRVKKYSYFYIGRKLWYIPLYFTVWFSFYVLWLILKSIARHKVSSFEDSLKNCTMIHLLIISKPGQHSKSLCLPKEH